MTHRDSDIHVEMRDIRKYYGPVKANDGVSLVIKKGSIHGALGENGAGKSTLMKILAGAVQKTGGSIRIDGRRADFKNPAMALRAGVGMLFQEPMDFPGLTVLENFMLGQSGGDRKTFLKKLEGAMARFNFNLDPGALEESLTIGQRHQLELLRLLEKGVRVLILDEPATGISDRLKEGLFEALRRLAAMGKSVVLVSHKLEDVRALCDEVTVLRRGKVAGRISRPFDAETVFEMMFKTRPPPFRAPASVAGEAVLEFRHVSAGGPGPGLKNCHVTARRGEITALLGVEGSGQSLFFRMGAGLKRPGAGEVFLRGQNMTGKPFRRFQEMGAAFLPADRVGEGLISSFSISEHFILKRKKGFFLNRKQGLETARAAIGRFDIKGSPGSAAGALSGGNQQRLLMSFLPQNPAVLLLEDPARGLDPESARMVWERLKRHAVNGAAVLFSSSEIDDAIMAAHRALVFFNGAIIKDFNMENADVGEIGRAIAGDIRSDA
ncbi:Sugar ABC transporter ATP-binding protein [Candidatus Desulfarcum epimagneticum]|uniref:Sugar ABC transporter ATP-binding protein n=1 Tax=uncultured Desulfobacteraceae bacterium TaxID=218296 RepID=A0A484HHV6_9BACT|nr:Sugar ABC transporter ATP-binding protein [uncultured Desulfobacteraceae bacterium]